MAKVSEELMQKMINDLNRKPDAIRLWITTPDPLMPRVPDGKWANNCEAFRKAAKRCAPIEQYTETLPRRWWQLKAATRIRIRRVQPQTISCRCSIGVK